MSYKFTGSKYQSGLPATEITKNIRNEIKAAVKAGTLPKAKYSVRLSRYAGGRSINVYVSDFPFEMLNLEWVKQQVLPYNTSVSLRLQERLTTNGQKLYADLEAIRSAYNFDDSDTMTDYYHVNFYGSVVFDTSDEYLAKKEQLGKPEWIPSATP